MLETPKESLSRIKHHVNGVYTQRHNRLEKTDGPFFRGRYKLVLVDEDDYLLPLARYIHLNPIETNRPMVKALGDKEFKESALETFDATNKKCWGMPN